MRADANTSCQTATLLDILDYLPDEDAALIWRYARQIAAQAMAEGLRLGSALMLAGLEYRVDVDAVVRELSTLQEFGLLCRVPPERVCGVGEQQRGDAGWRAADTAPRDALFPLWEAV